MTAAKIIASREATGRSPRSRTCGREARRREDVRPAEAARDGRLRCRARLGSASERSPPRGRGGLSPLGRRGLDALVVGGAGRGEDARSRGRCCRSRRRRADRDPARGGAGRRRAAAAPEGDGPWAVVVEARSPRDGAQTATLARRPGSMPASGSRRRCPRIPPVVPGDRVTSTARSGRRRRRVRRLPRADRRRRDDPARSMQVAPAADDPADARGAPARRGRRARRRVCPSRRPASRRGS